MRRSSVIFSLLVLLKIVSHSKMDSIHFCLTNTHFWGGGFRQRLMADMESLKQQVQAVQLCQSALRVPEEVMPSLAICRTALRLQQDASQLQHVAIQQCNILQVEKVP